MKNTPLATLIIFPFLSFRGKPGMMPLRQNLRSGFTIYYGTPFPRMKFKFIKKILPKRRRW